MAKISEKARAELKKPLGKIYKKIEAVRKLAKNYRITSVGDVCTLALLDAGLRPHLAVFDFRYKRKRLKTLDIRTLKAHYPKPRTYTNPAGTVSGRLLRDAGALLEQGGALFIEGEEDLTALAFIRVAGEGDVIVYGQPDEGMVVVRINERIKKKVEGFLIP